MLPPKRVLHYANFLSSTCDDEFFPVFSSDFKEKVMTCLLFDKHQTGRVEGFTRVLVYFKVLILMYLFDNECIFMRMIQILVD